MGEHARTWFTPQQRAELWERWKSGQCVADTAHLEVLHTLEFVCAECVEKIATSEAITLNSETSGGKVIARIKDR